jgi:hypothetical protein
VTAVTDLTTLPEPQEPASGKGRSRKLLVAAIVAAVVVLGIEVWFIFWWRRGGPRRAITELAEDGAVKLVDAALDEVFGAA